jgi:hypothetical protein
MEGLSMRVARAALLGVLLVFFATLVSAETITFRFTGHVTETNKAATFPLGQPVTGTYTFESTTPDANSGNAEQGAYDGALSRFAFESGSYSAEALESNPQTANDGGDILVNRDTVFSPQEYDVIAIWYYDIDIPDGDQQRWGPDVEGEYLSRMWLLLSDATETAITSIDLPVTTPVLSDFTTAEFGLIYESDGTGDPGVVFTLDSLTATSVSTEETSWGGLKGRFGP